MGKFCNNRRKPKRKEKKVTVGKAEAVPAGRGATVQLKGGGEIALFNVGGNFYAIENFCPHKGAPLADSKIYGNVVECSLHGWRFDVRNGDCFTKSSCSVESYEVVVEDGWIKVLI